MSNASPAASSSVWPEHRVAARLVDARDERVPAAGDQAEVGRLDRVLAEHARRHVPVQVVHGDQRQAARGGQRLGVESPTSSAPISPGRCVTATSRCRRASLRRARARRRSPSPPPPGAGARRSRERRRRSARAEPLRGDHVRADLPVAGDERGAGVVAARLDRRGSSSWPRGPPPRPPHDQGVLAVVVVIAAAVPRAAESEGLIERDGPRVGLPDLEGVLLVGAVGGVEEVLDQGCRDALPAQRADPPPRS